MRQSFFSGLDHITSHVHDLTSNDLCNLLTSRIVSIKIANNMGMLNIKGKLKTAALQKKYEVIFNF